MTEEEKTQFVDRLTKHVAKTWTALRQAFATVQIDQEAENLIKMAIAEAYGTGAADERVLIAVQVNGPLAKFQADLEQMQQDLVIARAEVSETKAKLAAHAAELASAQVQALEAQTALAALIDAK